MIWLIGNKGMLGADVESRLEKGGIDYCATDLDVDICDIDGMYGFADGKKISWIINCAAYTAVDRAEDEREQAFRINSEAVRNIAKVADRINSGLIHISTDYVFDGTKETAYIESDPTGPIGIYGESKLGGEENIRNILKRYFIIRTAWLYGRNGANFVRTMLRLFGERDTVKVVADQFGSPTYTVDLADAVVNIAMSGSEKFGIYNYTNAGRTNWHEFACEIYRLAVKRGLIEKEVEIFPIRTEDYPTKARRPASSYLSKDKILNAFGMNIRGWKEALEDYIEKLTGRGNNG